MTNRTNRRNFIAGLISAVAVCSTRWAIAATDSSPKPIDSRLANLSSLTADDLYQLHNEVYSHNNAIETGLINQLLSDATPTESRLYAAYFLGAFKFKGGTSALAEYITLEDKNPARRNHDTDGLWIWGKYPAMEALAKLAMIVSEQ